MGSYLRQSLSGKIHRIREFELEKVVLIDEFDIIQIVGEGWFGKILLVEHKATGTEMVLKALPKPYTAVKDFYREFHYGLHLGVHKNIITAYDVAFETVGFYVFSQEYAPLGDLTSNVSEIGIGELHTKRVAKQLAAALEHMHNRELVHRDVKLDNILVFKSDFSRIKLCDFGETRHVGSVVLRRNEWLPYAAPEILEIATDANYKCNTSHDVWQFGIVIFVCLTGCLPWQKAAKDDPRYVQYLSWQNSTLPLKRQPKLFKLVSSKAQKFFKRFLESRSDRRPTDLSDVHRYLDDRWMSKGMEKTNNTLKEEEGLCPSMYSFHSSPQEKNKLLFTLTQYGLETTVDRIAKKDRIRQWIQNSVIEEEDDIDEPDNSNEPIGERIDHRGHSSNIHNLISRKERRMSLMKLYQVEKEYKPPVDPRVPFWNQNNKQILASSKTSLINHQLLLPSKSSNSVSSSLNETVQLLSRSVSAVLPFRQINIERIGRQPEELAVLPSKNVEVTVENPTLNYNFKSIQGSGDLNSLLFRNVKVMSNSPLTSSDSAISSDGSTVKQNMHKQGKVVSEKNFPKNSLEQICNGIQDTNLKK